MAKIMTAIVTSNEYIDFALGLRKGKLDTVSSRESLVSGFNLI